MQKLGFQWKCDYPFQLTSAVHFSDECLSLEASLSILMLYIYLSFFCFWKEMYSL